MAAITNNATNVLVAADKGKNRRRGRRGKETSGSTRRQKTGQDGDSPFDDGEILDGNSGLDYLQETINGRPLVTLPDADSDARGTLEPAPQAATPVVDNEREQVNFLSMYFRDMAALEVLRPEEEFVAARNIEGLEIAVWEEIFSYPPAVAHMLDVLESRVENAPDEFRSLRRLADDARKSTSKAMRSKLAKAARSCAEKIQPIDSDKVYLEAVLAELGRMESGDSKARAVKLTFSPRSRGFAAYMSRVRVAEGAAAQARNEFVKANLRLVVSIARRFNHGRMALADLIQEGNIGLMKAVERYDYRRGFRFSTYASWWIRHAISRALADKGREVRLPVHMIDAHHRLSKAKRELTTKLGRQPSNDELAHVSQIPAEKIEKMRSYLLDQSFSLDRPINDEDGRSFVDFLQDPEFEENPPVDRLALQRLTDEVRRAMGELRPIEADILRQRFGLDDDHELTLKQIGEKYNLSRERIRQLQEQALDKVRASLQRRNIT